MYKTIRSIHLWFSVPLGLIMSLVCITGLIMLFEPAHAHGDPRPEFFMNVMRLHRWLFDAPAVKGAMTTGKMIVAISVSCMVVALVTGVILWWMRARRDLTRNLKISFHEGFRAFCTSLHTAGGIYVVAFLLVIALTGLTWSFGWYRAWFTSLFGIAKGSHVIYEIHTGAVGGVFTRVIWFAAVLTGFTLPLTGYYMWIKHLMTKRCGLRVNPRTRNNNIS